jgi:drug/metabolite transporter (DMT)-like permease
MNIFQITLIVGTITALSVGQILFKLAAVEMVLKSHNFWLNFLNFKLLIALIVYAVATATWVVVLKSTPLRLAYPFAALAFVIVPVLSYFFIGEPLRLNTIVGAAIILLGVIVSVGLC